MKKRITKVYKVVKKLFSNEPIVTFQVYYATSTGVDGTQVVCRNVNV